MQQIEWAAAHALAVRCLTGLQSGRERLDHSTLIRAPLAKQHTEG